MNCLLAMRIHHASRRRCCLCHYGCPARTHAIRHGLRCGMELESWSWSWSRSWSHSQNVCVFVCVWPKSFFRWSEGRGGEMLQLPSRGVFVVCFLLCLFCFNIEIDPTKWTAFAALALECILKQLRSAYFYVFFLYFLCACSACWLLFFLLFFLYRISEISTISVCIHEAFGVMNCTRVCEGVCVGCVWVPIRVHY